MPAYHFITRLICLLALLLAFPSAVSAQEPVQLVIDQIDSSQFPQVEILVSVRDGFGIPIQELFAEHFTLTEAGKPVTDFSVTPMFEQPLDLVLVMDTSATTGYGSKPTPLQSAGRAARNLVNSLGLEDYSAVVAFGNNATIVQHLTTNKHPVNASLSLLEPAGNSALNDAVLAALNLLKESQRPLIVLFTDGPDSGRSQMSTSLVAQAAFQHGVPVHIIGWRTANSRDLQNLAALTGGSLQLLPGSSPTPEDIQAAINKLQPVLKSLRGQYHVSYTSQLQADEAQHPLQVQIRHQGRRQQADSAFTATSQQVLISMPDLRDGQVVGGIIQLAPQVTAPAPLVSLEVMLDNELIAQLEPQAPEMTYDTAVLNPGPHRLTILASDSAGNQGRLDLDLEVHPPISITLVSPRQGELIRSEIMLAAKVIAIPELDRLEFWMDDQIIATRESSPYETTWDPDGLPAGTHQLRLVGYDVQGHSSEVIQEVTIPSTNYLPAILLVVAILAVTAVAIIGPLRLKRRLQQRDQELAALFSREPACLREVEGLNPGRIWELDKDEVRLGRKREENDIPLKGLSAARQQAIIRYQRSDYVIFSLFPEKPVLVNEIPVHPQAVLKSGDTLRLGETVLHFEMQG